MIFRILMLCYACGIWPLTVYAHDEEAPLGYMQVYLGAMDVDNDRVSLQGSDNGEAFTDEFPDDLVWGGGVVQMPMEQGALEFGLESGGFISWRNTDTDFAFINGHTFFKVDTSLVLLDLFLGAFVSTRVGDLVRLHAGAGPVLMLGLLDFEGDEVGDEDGDSSVVVVSDGTRIVLDDDENDSDLGLGGYVRVGIDLQWDRYSALGISARYLNVKLDFNQSFGRVDLKGPQLFLTFTQRY